MASASSAGLDVATEHAASEPASNKVKLNSAIVSIATEHAATEHPRRKGSKDASAASAAPEHDTKSTAKTMQALQAAMQAAALNTPSEFWLSGCAGRSAFQTVKKHALDHGVILKRHPGGKVSAEHACTINEKRYCVQDGGWYCLAETMEYVFDEGGDFNFAMRMWEQMLPDATEHQPQIATQQAT